MINRTIILLLSIFILGQAFAQRPVFDLNPFQERNIAIKEALMPGVVLLQVKYVVVDKDGNEFGSDGKDFFSTRYYVGAATEKGIMLPAIALKPEVGDSLFETYKTDYTARISAIGYRSATDTSAFTSVDVSKELDLENRTLLVEQKQKFEGHSHNDVSEGKLLLFVIDEGKDPATTVPRVSVITVDDLKWDAKGMADIKDIAIRNTTTIGGVFFYEKVDFASISYQMLGFYEQDNGNWYIQAVSTPVEEAPANELSPIGNKKKKR